MLVNILKEIVREKQNAGVPNFVIINFLKEYLQYPVLSYIYSSKNYKNFIFTGGSCLRICYNLPRLSEDIDFDLLPKDFKKLDLELFSKELADYFKMNYLLELKLRIQPDKRLYLKFPILKELGLSKNISESDFLYVKIELSKTDYVKPETEISPISKFGYNFIVRNYSLPYLMTGKIRALLNRTWFKGDENEINIKGRDFYDLFWYLQNNIQPVWSELEKFEGIKNMAELKNKLTVKIDKNITAQKLAYDLKNFFADQYFIDDFCGNYKKIIQKYL